VAGHYRAAFRAANGADTGATTAKSNCNTLETWRKELNWRLVAAATSSIAATGSPQSCIGHRSGLDLAELVQLFQSERFGPRETTAFPILPD
jgi:hypothetical protein